MANIVHPHPFITLNNGTVHEEIRPIFYSCKLDCLISSMIILYTNRAVSVNSVCWFSSELNSIHFVLVDFNLDQFGIVHFGLVCLFSFQAIFCFYPKCSTNWNCTRCTNLAWPNIALAICSNARNVWPDRCSPGIGHLFHQYQSFGKFSRTDPCNK